MSCAAILSPPDRASTRCRIVRNAIAAAGARIGLLGGIGESRVRALDRCGLGAWRFQLRGVGRPGDRVCDRGRSLTRQLDGAGRDGKGYLEFLSVWEEVRIEADEYLELDEARVLVLVRWRGRGKTSGLEVGHLGGKGASLLHVRDGKVTRAVLYWERERALADLGLSSETGLPRS